MRLFGGVRAARRWLSWLLPCGVACAVLLRLALVHAQAGAAREVLDAPPPAPPLTELDEREPPAETAQEAKPARAAGKEAAAVKPAPDAPRARKEAVPAAPAGDAGKEPGSGKGAAVSGAGKAAAGPKPAAAASKRGTPGGADKAGATGAAATGSGGSKAGAAASGGADGGAFEKSAAVGGGSKAGAAASSGAKPVAGSGAVDRAATVGGGSKAGAAASNGAKPAAGSGAVDRAAAAGGGDQAEAAQPEQAASDELDAPPPPPAVDGDFAGRGAQADPGEVTPQDDFAADAQEYVRPEKREYSIRIDLLNWLLLGRLSVELEMSVWKYLTVTLTPVFVVARSPIAINYAGLDDPLTQHSHGIGPLSGVSLGVGAWFWGEPFKGYVLRLEFTNYGYSYRTADGAGAIDRVDFTERRLILFVGSHSRFGAFTFAGGFGLGYELNQQTRCGLSYDEDTGVRARSDDCKGKQQIALDRQNMERANLNGPLHPVYFQARFSIGVVF